MKNEEKRNWQYAREKVTKQPWTLYTMDLRRKTKGTKKRNATPFGNKEKKMKMTHPWWFLREILTFSPF